MADDDVIPFLPDSGSSGGVPTWGTGTPDTPGDPPPPSPVPSWATPPVPPAGGVPAWGTGTAPPPTASPSPGISYLPGGQPIFPFPQLGPGPEVLPPPLPDYSGFAIDPRETLPERLRHELPELHRSPGVEPVGSAPALTGPVANDPEQGTTGPSVAPHFPRSSAAAASVPIDFHGSGGGHLTPQSGPDVHFNGPGGMVSGNSAVSGPFSALGNSTSDSNGRAIEFHGPHSVVDHSLGQEHPSPQPAADHSLVSGHGSHSETESLMARSTFSGSPNPGHDTAGGHDVEHEHEHEAQAHTGDHTPGVTGVDPAAHFHHP